MSGGSTKNQTLQILKALREAEQWPEEEDYRENLIFQRLYKMEAMYMHVSCDACCVKWNPMEVSYQNFINKHPNYQLERLYTQSVPKGDFYRWLVKA